MKRNIFNSIYIKKRQKRLCCVVPVTALVLCIVSVLLMALMTLMALRAADRIHMQRHIAGELVRFHVRANSDSCEDQTLKLEVRDAVTGYLAPLLAGSQSLEQSRGIIERNTGNIVTIAEKTIAGNDMDYNVNAYFAREHFPTRTYGDVTLPAGMYEAYRIDIGSARGHNWWCVLYPPLCFEDETHAVMSDSAREYLKDELTDEEYELITAGTGCGRNVQKSDGSQRKDGCTSDDGQDIIVRFRILKFLNRYIE